MRLMVRSFSLCAFLCLLKYQLPLAHGDESDVKPEYLDMLLNTSQYDEFSRLMRIEDSSIVRPAASLNTPRDFLYNDTIKGKVQGDILLRRWQRRIIRKGIGFAEYGINKWRNFVPYSISENYSPIGRKVIEDRIAYFNSKVQNILVPYKEDIDYIFIFPGAGFCSNLGKVGGTQAISFPDFGELLTEFVLHLLGHAIGMGHEQIQPDRDEYIHVIDENIPKSMKSQYDKGIAKDVLIVGPYDLYSIMHYPVLLLVSNVTAIEVLQENVNISAVGQTLVLTNTDIYKINKLCRAT